LALGKVYLIGAGPGSADLITLRGLRAMRKAQVLICDYLLPKTFLNELGIDTEGKTIVWLRDGDERKSQDEINRTMLEATSKGRTVARIKTGDPHIFGRGQEEQSFLTQNKINWEVVPGLSVLSAGPASLDYALTNRNSGRSFAAVSARCAGGAANHNFPKADSLIIFMGISVLEQVVESLLSQGWNQDSPAAIIERATMPWQKLVSGRLSEIAKLSTDKNLKAPAVLVVGSVAEQQNVSELRPKILFTGLDPTNFRDMGIIIHWPAVKVEPYEKGLSQLPFVLNRLRDKKYRYIIFTSKVTVRLFFDALSREAIDSRILADIVIITAGKGTAEEILEHGVIADIIPQSMGSAGICEQLCNCPKGNVLIIQSATATEKLASEIATELGDVTRLCLHHVIPHPDLGGSLPEHHVIYFTCPSGVRAYWEKYDKTAFEKEVWCIGDVTLHQLNEFGIEAKVITPNVS
jgi:uroporphyrinogen III methyltransferase/synthase